MQTPPKTKLIDTLISGIGSIPSLIIHTIAFTMAFFIGVLGLASWEIILLVLTTVVSLEAIYLAIFIQMSVNRNTASLLAVEEDIDEIQEDVEELGEDVDDIQEDVEEMQENIEEMVEEEPAVTNVSLEKLAADLELVLKDIEALKKQ